MLRRVPIPSLIRPICRRSRAPAASAPMSSFQRKSLNTSRPRCPLANMLPRCWDGKSLDSPNHKDHIAYPANGSFASGGPCPSTHPVKIPQIFLEVVWDTAKFNNQSIWPEDGSQPFFLSMGDHTGYGQHADYVFGWKGDSLQRAMENSQCVGSSCPELKIQSFEDANNCRVRSAVPERVDGCKSPMVSLRSATPVLTLSQGSRRFRAAVLGCRREIRGETRRKSSPVVHRNNELYWDELRAGSPPYATHIRQPALDACEISECLLLNILEPYPYVIILM